MVDGSTLPLGIWIAIFVLCAVVIAVVGTRMAAVSDRLADVTGWGEAAFGAIVLGGSTSLPGIVTSTSAALDGHADLAFSNAIGGIAAQTVFLAIADMFYPKANLEHAAASASNMMQGALLIILLMLVLVVMTGPAVALGGVHPGSVLLVCAYVYGIRLIRGSRWASTWKAEHTPETVLDDPDVAPADSRGSSRNLWLKFWGFALLLGIAGHAVAKAGATIAKDTGLPDTVMGGFFTAVTTSLPELVTAVAAVRRGALTLAVGNIIGGNAFDILFVATADVAYRNGPIYAMLDSRHLFAVALAGLLTAVLLLGLLRREKCGIAGIGFESFLILILYAGGMALLSAWPALAGPG